MALRGCNRRFRERFREMEMASKLPLEGLSGPELEALWAMAKKKLSAEGAEGEMALNLKPGEPA
jgi:XTP/dITP diphosphohydrolase/ATP diphosphatase